MLESDLFYAFADASENVYIYVCNPNSDLTHWSKNAVDYFDMTGEYISNTAEYWMSKIHPADKEKYFEDISQVFSGKKRNHRCEYRAINRFGDYVWLECRGTMIDDENGNPSLFAGIMTRLDAQNKYDPLTNLRTIHSFNKFDFSDGAGSLLLIGADYFRTIINNYGFVVGDTVLREFAKKLMMLCGEKRTAYRFQGDEFVIVSPGSDREDTEKLFYDIVELGNDLGYGLDQRIKVRFSGGAVMYPEDGIQRDLLISKVQHSLEKAKADSRGNMVFFSQEIADTHRRRTSLQQALSASISEDMKGFEMYYQPIVKCDSGEIVSCEALLRWKHPDIEAVNIGEVIKMMEGTGEIRVVGRWIVDQVLDYSAFCQRNKRMIMIGFNVSYIQFKDFDFVDYLIDGAKKRGINPNLVCIELTESCKVEDFEYLSKCFEKLREAGFKMSLDDFGIAYSSLLLIKNLSTDSVKIDHSFIINLTEADKVDLAIIESVVTLCHKLGIRVVAEGIESAAIADLMKQFKVNYLQGYYFNRPMPVSDFDNLFEEGKAYGPEK